MYLIKIHKKSHVRRKFVFKTLSFPSDPLIPVLSALENILQRYVDVLVTL